MKNNETLSFRRILNNVALAEGLDAESGEVNAVTARKVVRAVNAALAYAWEYTEWDALCRVTTNPDWLDRGFQLLALYGEDPVAAWQAGTDPKVIPFRIAEGVIIPEKAPASLWYYCQRAVPVMGWETYDNDRLYRRGDVVYNETSGDCFLAEGPAAGVPPSIGGTYGSELGTVVEWVPGFNAAVDTIFENREGLLFRASFTHATAAQYEPGYGASWEAKWVQLTWQPQRVPKFLEEAVLNGAEKWLQLNAEGQPTTAAALGKVMDDWMENLAVREGSRHRDK